MILLIWNSLGDELMTTGCERYQEQLQINTFISMSVGSQAGAVGIPTHAICPKILSKNVTQ